MVDLIDTWRGNRRSRNLAAGEIIETWNVGAEQPQANDIGRFMREGYSKNSLIYSCIREKATSFGPLHPQIVRADGSVITRHRMLQLLQSPKPYQDGAEFAETMMSHYEAAGNVYVQKVRVSADPERRAAFSGFPIQELSLIRPDYVSIIPGVTRRFDVFAVTVGGIERARIPRADMIHIHEPNLINDFYGLSKIALITREGSIDLEMSDFELAFYRNAGVPMGMLSVKGNVTQEQSTEIKSAFRRMYNGAKHWFDVLVTNADEATYHPMGLKPADMVGDMTRSHIESRICSVFGVPPIIVGARLAMSGGGTTFTYEDAEHSFWAETMVPGVERFARAWTQYLLSEFGVSADRGAKVGYDFTSVRALQEDRSRKHREVVRMVNAGFTVNQALVMNGLPAIDGGDIRILTGNQLLVDLDNNIVFQADTSSSEPNPPDPFEGAARIKTGAGNVLDEVQSIFRGRDK